MFEMHCLFAVMLLLPILYFLKGDFSWSHTEKEREKLRKVVICKNPPSQSLYLTHRQLGVSFLYLPQTQLTSFLLIAATVFSGQDVKTALYIPPDFEIVSHGIRDDEILEIAISFSRQ